MPNDNEHNDDKNPPFEGRTYLYIRTHPADNGNEPLPASLPFWTSPDITIIKPDGSRGNEAVAGGTNHIEVIVRNAGGIEATDAFVDIFVADPSTAFVPPGFAATGTTAAHAVGSGFLSVAGYSAMPALFPWVPTTADAGHRCLLARVSLIIPPDSYTDPSKFNVIGDRHVAQRNIHVVEMLPRVQSLSFGFLLVNPLTKRERFKVCVRPVKVTERDADSMRSAIGCRFVQFAAESPAGWQLIVGDKVEPSDPSIPRQPKDAPPLGQLPYSIPGKVAEGEIEMEGGEALYATVTIDRNASVRIGDVQIIEVLQTSMDSEEPIGGLWLVVIN